MNPLISAITGLASPLIDRFFPDKSKAQEFAQQLELELLRNQTAINTAQTDVNKIEAASDDAFTRRWRPFIGWVCGSAFAVNFVVIPLLRTLPVIFGYMPVNVAPLDMGEMMPVLLGMLGLGGMRTYEKVSR